MKKPLFIGEFGVPGATTADNDADGQIDRLIITFDTNADIVDGNAGDGFPQVTVT